MIQPTPSTSMWPFELNAITDHLIAGRSIAQWTDDWIPEGVTAKSGAWISKQDSAKLTESGNASLVNAEGTCLATSGEGSKTIQAESSFFIIYPWNLLNVAEQVIGDLEENVIKGDIHPNAVIEGIITLGKGSRILPGVYIEGNATIGENCKIGPNCYIRGNTSIGNNVHIGQSVEVKNSIIGNDSAAGHLSYIGDSIIGDKVNLGAGTITSNFRHDGSNHRSKVNGELVDTGRRKFGTAIGNGVHTGIHTSIYPGRKLEATATTLPGGIVTEDLFL
ncbi:hypothetical protein OAB00_03625 [Akkermansiaceae bacterium]|nr:hypothetical protein [Akkermansiaceae bacterium]